MEIKSKSVKLFCAVVDSGSLLAAANKIALSTSAASRVISQLEERLGFPLFDRSTKNLTLTADGAEFYRLATESMRVWKILEDYPQTRKSPKKLLRIAVLSRHCTDVILPAVVKILREHEKTLRVSMDVHQSRDIYYSKYSHPFDVGFGTLLSEHDDLKKVCLANLPFCLVVNKANPLSRLQSVTAAEYEKEKFILLSPDTQERELSDALLPPLTDSQIVAEISSTQVALRMVGQNLGVHITDVLAARSVSRDCVALPLAEPKTIPFYVFWPARSESLWPEIRQCIAEIALSIKNIGLTLTAQGEGFIESEKDD